MRYRRTTVALVAFLFMSGSCLVEAGEMKIGTVDLSRTFDGYQKTKDAEKTLEAEGNNKKQERDKKVEEIKRLKGELDLLNDKAKAEKQAVIDQKVQELQAFDREVQGSLRRERDRVIQEILKEIDGVIGAYGRDNGYTLLLNDRALLYRGKELDVTDQILGILNQNTQGKKAK